MNSEMRVAVAKEVLWLMENTNLLVDHGYGALRLINKNTSEDIDAFQDLYKNAGEKLQRDIPKIADECAVCAKGAMVLAHIHLYDGVDFLPIGLYADRYSTEFIGEHFSNILEACFENWKCLDENDNIVAGTPWTKAFPDSRIRLQTLMNNVIRNNGDFNPRELY